MMVLVELAVTVLAGLTYGAVLILVVWATLETLPSRTETAVDEWEREHLEGR